MHYNHTVALQNQAIVRIESNNLYVFCANKPSRRTRMCARQNRFKSDSKTYIQMFKLIHTHASSQYGIGPLNISNNIIRKI